MMIFAPFHDLQRCPHFLISFCILRFSVSIFKDQNGHLSTGVFLFVMNVAVFIEA